MKFLQVHTYYPGYLPQFEKENPACQLASHKRQTEMLLADGFAASHLFAPHLPHPQFESRFIAANWPLAQQTWAVENGVSPKLHPSLILQKQIAAFQPDVIYFTNPIAFDSRFVRSLEKRPTLVMGWRAAEVPADTDWSDFDLIISNNPPTLREAVEHGARAVEPFSPGFPQFIADAMRGVEESVDVSFCGSWSYAHGIRNKIWTDLSKTLLRRDTSFQLQFHIFADDPAQLPLAISMHDQGAKFGLAMHRALKQSRISLNALSHVGETISANMRLFEIAGTGGFQLMEHHSDITNYFEPGKEIVTYTGVPDMVEKIEHYLAHPEERRLISQRGQERCLTQHSMKNRVLEFAALVERYLGVVRSHPAEVKRKVQKWTPALDNSPKDEIKALRKQLARNEEKLAQKEKELNTIKGSWVWRSMRWMGPRTSAKK